MTLEPTAPITSTCIESGDTESERREHPGKRLEATIFRAGKSSKETVTVPMYVDKDGDLACRDYRFHTTQYTLKGTLEAEWQRPEEPWTECSQDGALEKLEDERYEVEVQAADCWYQIYERENGLVLYTANNKVVPVRRGQIWRYRIKQKGDSEQ
jgi:hypothetical protein